MRPLILLLFALSLTAAELEQITLTDGRRLVGYYDDIAGTVTLDGPAKAVLPIAARQVASRAPYIRGPETAADATAPAQREAAKAPREGARARLDRARSDAEQLRAKADAVELDAVVEFLSGMDLTPQTVDELGKDPRKSEIEHRRRAMEVNVERKEFARLLADAKLLKSDPTTGHGFVATDLIHRMRNLEAEAKKSAAHADARAAKAK